MAMKSIFFVLFLAAFSEKEILRKVSRRYLQKQLPLFLNLVEAYSEPRNSIKMKMIGEQWSKMNVTGKLSVFPNEMSAEIFLDMETNEFSWKDPKEIIRKQMKSEIEWCLRREKEKMSNLIFYYFSVWDVSPEARPFVKELLFAMSKSIEIDKRDQCNRSPLLFAVKFDADKAVAKLIERGAETQGVSECGSTALHMAAYWGSRSSCKVLLQKGENANAAKNANADELEEVQLLLDWGADAKITDNLGNTASELATLWGRQDCGKLIDRHEKVSMNDKPAAQKKSIVQLISKPILVVSLILLFFCNLFFLGIIILKPEIRDSI